MAGSRTARFYTQRLPSAEPFDFVPFGSYITDSVAQFSGMWIVSRSTDRSRGKAEVAHQAYNSTTCRKMAGVTMDHRDGP
jgi:hypothetical protein